jgi:dipeptidyl aminopeptidase/acylaminoacyl peptidase
LALAIMVLAYVGPSVYIAATLTRPERKPITAEPAALGLAAEPVTFASRDDGLALRGWLLPGRRGQPAAEPRLIVVVHGINGVRDDPSIGLLPIAAGLVEAGYDVLLFDLRGHGESAGDRASLGWFERRDLAGALDWAEGRGYRRVGVHGFSMGAATALLTAAEDARIAAVASDSSYADLGEILAVEIPRRSRLPSLYTPGALLAARLLYGADLTASRPGEAIVRLRDRPVLLVHGAVDRRTPVVHAERLWAARYGDADAREQLAIFPGADHVQAYHSDPAAYMTLVLRFWDAALGAPAAADADGGRPLPAAA